MLPVAKTSHGFRFVLGLVLIEIGGQAITRNAVLFARPFPKVDELATLRAKRPPRVLIPQGRAPAERTGHRANHG